MNADQIPAHEERFDNTGIDSDNKRHILTPRNIQIPGEDALMNYTQVESAAGDNSFYYRQETAKNQIVLHFTAGYLQGDIATLTTPNNPNRPGVFPPESETERKIREELQKALRAQREALEREERGLYAADEVVYEFEDPRALGD